MARMQCDGLADLRKRLGEVNADLDQTLIRKMLKAGTPPVVSAWQKSMRAATMSPGTVKTYTGMTKKGRAYNYQKASRSTGASASSVSGKIDIKKSAVGTSNVAPRGTRSRGNKKTRNAEIAFILNYGRTKQKQAPTNFVDNATRSSENECVENMTKVFDEYLRKKGLT
jgi:hypothetical protein